MRTPIYKTIYLYVTQACNSKCSFCYRRGLYERHDVYKGEVGPIHMSSSTALDAVNFTLDKLQTDDSLNFYFWGGEPFVNFKVIKEVIDTFPQFEYHTNTNGALITEEIADYLVNNKHFSLTWSLGNAYEKYGSIEEKIKQEPHIARVIRESPVRNSLNLTVSNYNNLIKDFECLINEFDCRITIDFATRKDNTDEEVNTFVEQYLYLVKKYMRKGGRFEALNPAMRNPLWFETFGPTELIDRYKYCKSGLERLFIDTKGDIWQCDNMFICQHNKLGDIKNGIDYSKLDFAYDILDNKDSYLVQFCTDCEINGYCPRNKCLGYNLEWTGNMFKPEESFCKMCKGIFKVIKQYVEYEKEVKNGIQS